MCLFHHKSLITKHVRITTHISCIFGLFGSIFTFVVICRCAIESLSFWDRGTFGLVAALVSCIGIIKISTYDLFLSKLRHSFQESAFKISNYIVYIARLLFLTSAIIYSFIVYILCLLSPIGPENIDPAIQWKYLRILNTAVAIIDFVNDGLLLFVFNGTLFRVMRLMKSSLSIPLTEIKSEQGNGGSSPLLIMPPSDYLNQFSQTQPQ